MNFSDAVQEMMQGNIVTRDKYDASGEYYLILPAMPHVWKVVVRPQIGAGQWQPFIDDLVASDWKAVSRVPVLEDAEVKKAE